MQNVLTDTKGNTITMNYDSSTDMVTINDSSRGSEYFEVGYNQSPEVLPLKVVNIYFQETWNDFSDENTRNELNHFFEINKVNKG